MISFLKGILADIQKPGGSKIVVTLEVQQIGYDLLMSARHLSDLPPMGESTQVYSHLQVKDDQMILYGFASRPERDLFRQLTSVSGVGPQMALALLDTLTVSDLVQAILSDNARLLARTPGVGGKTAERLILELKTRLRDWHQKSGLPLTSTGGPVPSVQEEVEVTLMALGYTPDEILQALAAVAQQTVLQKTADPEVWVRAVISWLSQ